MPRTLWRYTFVELWRVVLICTAVLVSVIAFAASAKPLAEGSLSPLGAIRFMLLAVPPMLAYALPFAAGFGASLVYHRMAQDNEMIAAHSGGISHRKLLVPAVVSGVLLSGGVVVLNEWIIPRFLHAMERMITQDVAQIMINQIDRGQAAELNNVMIYADRIDRVDPPEGSSARQMFRLLRVAAVQLDDERRVVSDATVQRAWIVLAPDPADDSSTRCLIHLEDGVGSRSDGGLQRIGGLSLKPIPIPDAFKDDPKFLTFGELRALRGDPDEMGFVDSVRVRLAERLALADLRATLENELTAGGRLSLRGDGGRRFELAADFARRHSSGVWFLGREGGPVQLRRYEPGEDGSLRVSIDRAREAWLRVEQGGGASVWDTDDAGPALRFTLQLVDVHTTNEGGVATERPRRDYESLRLLDDPLSRYDAMSSGELLAEVERRGEACPKDVASAARALRDTIEDLGREITSKQQERLGLAASTFVMIVLGAISGMIHRDSLPLVVYLWSFFPALMMILLVSSGQQETHGHSPVTGIPLLWSGVAAGVLISLFSFFKLSKH
ncbi:MAG TPA: LptF/LptG family permease [Phycisphaerales bacterium]|nr:LptF/LptG family permease [Phycisphaerales bacterium]